MRMIICDLCERRHQWVGGGMSVAVRVDPGREWTFDLCLQCTNALGTIKRAEVQQALQRLVVHPLHRTSVEEQ